MEALRDARRARGWPLKRVAEDLGVTRSTVSKWETGSTRMYTDQVVAVLDALGASPEQRRAAWSEFFGVPVVDLPALLGLVPDEDDVAEGEGERPGWFTEDLPDADDPWDDEVYEDDCTVDELDEEVCG